MVSFQDDDDAFGGEEESEDDENAEPEKKTESGKKGGTWEDIYGRTRDSDGNVVQATATKYVPPALRAQVFTKKLKSDTVFLNFF